jgi:hypothetical protein
MNRLSLLVFFMALALLSASALHAQDTDITILVNAFFVPGNDVSAVFPSTGPTFNVSGTLVLNETSNQISAYNLTFTTPSGTTQYMSSLNGGLASIVNGCPSLYPNCLTTPGSPGNGGYLGLLFTQGKSSADLWTNFYSSAFTVGETIGVCPTVLTYYGDNLVNSPPCPATSTAGFNGQTGVVYGVTNFEQSSGDLSILSIGPAQETPELPSWILLAAGAMVLGLFEMLRRRV